MQRQTNTDANDRAANGLRVVCVMCLMKLTALAVFGFNAPKTNAKSVLRGVLLKFNLTADLTLLHPATHLSFN